MKKNLKVKTVKFRIPKRCICPSCGRKQPFKKEREYCKTVKDIDTNRPTLFKVRMVYAKCLKNPSAIWLLAALLVHKNKIFFFITTQTPYFGKDTILFKKFTRGAKAIGSAL